MNYITQSELDGLAAMANQVLLPIVNENLSGGSDTLNPWYDDNINGPINATVAGWAGVAVSPQPAYSFAPVTFANLVPAGAAYDGSGNYSLTLPASGVYNYIQGANDASLQDPSGYEYFYSTTNFYMEAGAIILGGTGATGAPVTAVVTQSPSALLKEMNRIRGSAMALVFGDGGAAYAGGAALFLNPAAVCSGPWVVGVNEPQTWDTSTWGVTGILGGGLATDGSQVSSFCIFDGVAFVSQSPSVTVASQFACTTDFPTVNVWTSAPAGYWGGYTSTLKLITTKPGHLQVTVTMTFAIDNANSTTPAPPVSAVGFTATPNFGALTLTDPTDTGHAVYQFTGTYDADVAAGETDFVFTFNVPDTWGVLTNGGETWEPGAANISAATVTGTLTVGTAAASSATPAVTPQGEAYSAPAVSLNGQWCYLVNGSSQFYFYPQFALSDPTAPGVWVAKTLPAPGINVFVDQDIPPHVGGMAALYHGAAPTPVAVSGAGQMDGTTAAPWASSMRQAAPVQTGTPDVTTVGGVNAAQPGITTRPAKWLVRRDTDFVPYDLGFNNAYGNYLSNVYAGQVVAPAGMAYYNVAMPPNATAARIWLVKPGTRPGWNNGSTGFSYGQPVGSALDLYVCQASEPPLPTGYDFEATGNYVTMDGNTASASNWLKPDGSSGASLAPAYLAGVIGTGFNFAVANPGADPVNYDVYVEIDVGTPQRIYTPPCGEVYSYCLNGTPGVYFGLMAMEYGDSGSKPIPQSGYCLFMARATRLPTDNGNGVSVTPASGDALTVTLGQNVLNSDGSITFTPFGSGLALTIPATAGTSGDTAIFIPVLAGNEVIYQCSEQVIVEVWANWQPLWFNAMYGLGQFPYNAGVAGTPTYQAPAMTAFQTALTFANDFNAKLAGWTPPYFSPDTGSGYNMALGSAVVFPLFRELYDDTVALLGLLGGSLPTGTDTGGAGGAGGAGNISGDEPGGAGGVGGWGAL